MDSDRMIKTYLKIAALVDTALNEIDSSYKL